MDPQYVIQLGSLHVCAPGGQSGCGAIERVPSDGRFDRCIVDVIQDAAVKIAIGLKVSKVDAAGQPEVAVIIARHKSG